MTLLLVWYNIAKFGNKSHVVLLRFPFRKKTGQAEQPHREAAIGNIPVKI